jgi:hypothetical protein
MGEELGRGASGVCYSAVHRVSGRRVAAKVMRVIRGVEMDMR